MDQPVQRAEIGGVAVEHRLTGEDNGANQEEMCIDPGPPHRAKRTAGVGLRLPWCDLRDLPEERQIGVDSKLVVKRSGIHTAWIESSVVDAVVDVGGDGMWETTVEAVGGARGHGHDIPRVTRDQ